MSAGSAAADAPLRWPTLLGEDELVRRQVAGVLFSTATYLLYGLITAVAVALGVVAAPIGSALVATGLLANGLFYTVVRSGRARTGRDPGLAASQLWVGIGFMYAGYAAMGPAATATMISLASHVTYAMFFMTPRQVWRLVALNLLGLAVTMLACHLLWPARYRPEVQVLSLLFALLVVPMIALLADRITQMTRRLKTQHAQLQDALARLQDLATRDELTRAHNRRHMSELLAEQQAHHRRQRAPLSVALIDIDHFKQVNDQHGHATGDEVLRRFADLARQQLRAADQLARWGGEEFLVLMPHTRRDDGVTAIQRLLQALRDQPPMAMPHDLAITFSAGVTELKPDERIDAAVERADQAMYRAKTSGRARVLPG